MKTSRRTPGTARPGSSWGALLVGCWLVGLLGLAADAHAFTFGQYTTQTGSQWTAFDWTTQHCETWDIPDQPARAFKDDQGNVQLIASHGAVRREIGPDLNSVRHQCRVVYMPIQDPDPSHFDDLLWPSAFYTLDGKTIYALAHTEYRGFNHNNCPFDTSGGFSQTAKCWYNAITLMRSTDSGATYTHATPPDHLIAAAPEIYVPGTGPDGVFTPSNIVYRQSDGYYYSLVRATQTAGGPGGTCVIRTRTLSDPKSWRAWDGSAFGLRFINPYLESGSPRNAHMCAFVSRNEIQSSTESLTWSNYYGKYLLVGAAAPGNTPPGFYFSLSDDLIHWTPRKLLMAANVPWLPNCGDPDPVRDPSVLDPSSNSRTFETVGQTANLYFIQLHVERPSGFPCYWPEHRDLMAIPIRFSGTPPQGSFSATPNEVFIGQTVRLDASASSDPNGSITKYEWDLDGNGVFETSSGSNPVLTTSFAKVPNGDVGLRVTDSEGFADDYYGPVTVNAAVRFQRDSSPTPAGFTKDIGSPYSDTRGYGWVREDSLSSQTHTPLDLTANTVDRDPAGSDSYPPEQDSFIFMHYPGTDPSLVKTSGGWEMALPCNVYVVTVSVGDSAYSSSSTAADNISTHRINVEGQTAIAGFQPTDASKFRSATVTVSVCDGRVTIDSIGGSNAKLNYVKVVPRPVARPTFSSTDPSSPANYNNPKVKGSAEASSTVKLYTNASCSGSPVATGSAASFASPGLPVSIPDNSTTTFYGTATDAANHISACSSSSITYVEDSTAPETLVNSGPSGATNDNTPIFEFSSNESQTTFACRLDGPGTTVGAFASCTSPTTFTPLADGSYTFLVQATDAANNSDQAPASRSFTVDTTAPNTLISSGPQGQTSSTSANFEFSSPETNASFQCRRDGGNWIPCTSPLTYSGLSNGSHSFEVRAIDAAGNTDTTPALRSWTVATTPPETMITSGPSGTTNSTSATFSFTSTEPDSAFECGLDIADWSFCTSPKTYPSLSEGSHTFRVRASGPAGNTDPSEARWTWIVQFAPPAATILPPLVGINRADPFAVADTTAPTVDVVGKTSQRALKQKGVVVEVGCPAEACSAKATGTVWVSVTARAFKLRPASAQIRKGGKARLKLRFSRKRLGALTRFLETRSEIKAKVTVAVIDAAGNTAAKRRTIKLKK